MLEKMVNLLVPLHQKEDPFFVPAFLLTYGRFTTTGQVLDLLFNRYVHFQPNSEEDQQVKNTLCSMLAMWLDRYPDDFCQSKDLDNLNKLKTYVLLHMPSSDLVMRGYLLLTQLEEQDSKKADQEGEHSLGRSLRIYEYGGKPVPHGRRIPGWGMASSYYVRRHVLSLWTLSGTDLGLHTAPAPEVKAEDGSGMAADVALEPAASPAAQEDLVPPQDSVPHIVVVQYVPSV
ncbi:ral guanine nucleotide dissociation stimulator-like [Perognathus longimembris pacificus]|uniref:ral guanine nucleotide dissociation stimulator-like n=1 Tax=Perognathus longimembris pacificus TaxID=214514 RepID=UPI002019517E|nr:ral guanine nucleotide dissociation stimulator-like [Perognathus longimembris pacificus]